MTPGERAFLFLVFATATALTLLTAAVFNFDRLMSISKAFPQLAA